MNEHAMNETLHAAQELESFFPGTVLRRDRDLWTADIVTLHGLPRPRYTLLLAYWLLPCRPAAACFLLPCHLGTLVTACVPQALSSQHTWGLGDLLGIPKQKEKGAYI
jgi:hypothetical protein